MQNPFPHLDTFDTNKDYDRRPPIGSRDYAHITQQQWNNGGNSQPHPPLFHSTAALTTTTAMTPFATTKDYSRGTEDNTPLYATLRSADNGYMTQQQNRRDTSSELFTPQPVRGSMLLQPQAVGDSSMLLQPQAVGDSPAGTEDNIDMTQQQQNDWTTPHAAGGSIPTALLGNTHTSTTTTALPGNTTHWGMTPITPTTATSKAVSGSGIQPTLQNIVATVNLGCKLDLKLIAQRARNAEYNPKRFGAVIMRIREPRTTALVFSSGKMVCTGATSVEQSRLAARKFARAVQKLGFPATFLDFKVQNMVGSCDVKFPVKLETLYFHHQQFSQYEPETFPGLIYKMIEPRINLLIFVSGKVVLTGAKTREEINQAFENIYPILRSFEKTPSCLYHRM